MLIWWVYLLETQLYMLALCSEADQCQSPGAAQQVPFLLGYTRQTSVQVQEAS